MLYIVPTPVGNLKDFTFRAIEVLKNSDLILAEDTRTSGRLLKEYSIEASMKSFHIHNEHKMLDGILEKLNAGLTISLVSDAGTPGISDPGFLLCRAARENNIEISCLPGPTAFVPALVNAGLPCDRFHFEGFLPHKKGRQTRLKYLASLEETFVLYESPHRIIKAIGQLIEFCGNDRPASISREISKLHEEVINGSLLEIKTALKQKPSIKGEFVVVVGGTNSLAKN